MIIKRKKVVKVSKDGKSASKSKAVVKKGPGFSSSSFQSTFVSDSNGLF